MPANPEELANLFARHGLGAFLNSTRTLVALLSEGGRLLAWNSAFDALKQALHDAAHLRDFLALSSRTIFDLCLSTVTHDHLATQGELDLGQGNQLSGYTCFLYPIPEGRVLFVAEPSQAALNLESLSAELQKTKHTLERKETELQSVLAQPRESPNTDALTSLPNRRQIMVELQEAVAFAGQYGTPLSILMLDIDHFKRINDAHGHGVGDEVLRNLAGQLRQAVRIPETIGRYGGEEFLIVLPHTTLQSAAQYAARLCEQVRVSAIAIRDQTISVTVSVGVALYRIKEEDWQTFLQHAEQALTQAKVDGRDRWAISGE